MKPLRLFYLALLLASIVLSLSFYFKHQLKEKELLEYQQLSQISSQAFGKVNAQLVQNMEELRQSSKKIEELNSAIAALEKDNTKFQGAIEALKQERNQLQAKILGLSEEKIRLTQEMTALSEERIAFEKRLLALEKKFGSLKELKRAIKTVRLKGRQERIQRRLAEKEMLKALDQLALKQGNRGYLVKAGETTFKPRGKVTVELEPVSTLSQKDE